MYFYISGLRSVTTSTVTIKSLFSNFLTFLFFIGQQYDCGRLPVILYNSVILVVTVVSPVSLLYMVSASTSTPPLIWVEAQIDCIYLSAFIQSATSWLKRIGLSFGSELNFVMYISSVDDWNSDGLRSIIIGIPL